MRQIDQYMYQLRLNAGGSTGSSAPQAGALVSKGENALGTIVQSWEPLRVYQERTR